MLPCPDAGRAHVCGLLRQTVVDLSTGALRPSGNTDLDRDGTPDLRPDRHLLRRISLGGIYGTMLNASARHSRRGSSTTWRLGDPNRSPGKELSLLCAALRRPVGNAQQRDGDFDEERPGLRDQPYARETTPKRATSRSWFDHIEWLTASGDPLFFASRLKKPVLWLIAKGDQSVPNPAISALIRRTACGRVPGPHYRHDLAARPCRR